MLVGLKEKLIHHGMPTRYRQYLWTPSSILTTDNIMLRAILKSCDIISASLIND